MIEVENFRSFLNNSSNYKEIMEKLKIDNANEFACNIIDFINYIIENDYIKKVEASTVIEMNKIFSILNNIIDVEYNNINIDELTIKLMVVLKMVDTKARVQNKEKIIIFFNEIKHRIANTLLMFSTTKPSNNKYQIMEYLVFCKRDINYFKYINNLFPSFLITNDTNGVSLYEKVLEKYVEETGKIKKFGGVSSDLLYYEKVLSVFIKNPFFSSQKENIKNIMKDTKIDSDNVGQNHVIKQFNRALCNEKLFLSPNIKYENGLNAFLKSLNCDEDRRYDFNGQYVFTIDTPKAELLDDAFTVRKLRNGNYLLCVHISDVVSFLDKSLNMRNIIAKNFCFDSRCNNCSMLCSLRPNRERNALSHLFEFDKDGNTVNFKAIKSKICSKRKLNFFDVQRVLNSDTDIIDIELLDNLILLNNLYELTTNDSYVKKDSNRNENIGDHIVENFMVFTSANVADFFDKNDLPFLYKVKKAISINDIYRFTQFGIDDIEKSDENKYLEGQSGVRFSSKNIGYSERNLSAYCHVTSPIIEVSDRIAQAIEHSFLVNSYFEDNTIYMWEKYLKELEATEGPRTARAKVKNQ